MTLTQFLVTSISALELASDIWLELVIFAVAAISYALFAPNGALLLPPALQQIGASSKKSSAVSRPKGIVRPPADTTQPSGTAVQRSSEEKSAGASTNWQASVAAIRARGRAGDLQGVVQVFEKLGATGNAVPAQVHNCVVEAHIQCGNVPGALEHFWEMSRTGIADVVTYNTILKALLGLGRTDDVQKLLREMASRGLPASRVTFHELLHDRVIAGDQRGMWKLIDEMQAVGLEVDAVTCSILVKSLKSGVSTAGIQRVMKFVAEIGGMVDEVLLSSVVEACVRIRRLDILSEVMRRFESEGRGLKLAAPGYGSLIKAYGQARDIKRMWELWQDMSQSGVQATSVTLGCMIDALVKNQCVEDAWGLVHDVYNDADARSTVNTVIYSTILKGFSQARDIERVFAVHSEMVERGIPCNVISYNTMIDACARSNAMDRVSTLLRDMNQNGVDPDLVTYSTLVKGYSLAGDVSRGFKVLEEMKSSGNLKPDEIMCNSLLEGCAREHRIEEALQLLDDMQANGVVPSNCTLSILVKLLGRSRRLDEAFRLIDCLSARHSFRPNVQVYTCLISACIHNRRIDRAMAAHDAMLGEAGCWPDEKAYSVLVRGCLEAGALDKAEYAARCAYWLHKDMPRKSMGVAPGVDASLLQDLVSRLCTSSGHHDLGHALAADLHSHHKITVGTCNVGQASKAHVRNTGKAPKRGPTERMPAVSRSAHR